MMPTAPGKNAIGMNTEDRTSVMPMTAPVICVIALRVALSIDSTRAPRVTIFSSSSMV